VTDVDDDRDALPEGLCVDVDMGVGVVKTEKLVLEDMVGTISM
jgi:hypothetical protein